MVKKFKKALNRLLFVVAVFTSLGINLRILLDSLDMLDKSDKLVDWSLFVGTNPWWCAIAGIIFSCSNLLFWVVGIDTIGKHLYEDWGKSKGTWGP